MHSISEEGFISSMLWTPLCSFHGDHKLYMNGTGDGLGTWEQCYSRFLSSCKYSHNGGNSLQFRLNVILSHFFFLVFYFSCNPFVFLLIFFFNYLESNIFLKELPRFCCCCCSFFLLLSLEWACGCMVHRLPLNRRLITHEQLQKLTINM